MVATIFVRRFKGPHGTALRPREPRSHPLETVGASRWPAGHARSVSAVKLVGGLLVLMLSMAALAGTAGLASLRGEDSCANRFPREEGSTAETSQPLSLWPPGVDCRLLAADGRVLDEVKRSAWGFLALVALEVALIVGVARSRTTIPLALRAASIATAGLLAWGVGSLWLGAVLGATVSIISLAGPAAGFVVDRRLRRVGRTDRRRADGLLGLVLAPASTVLGLFVWLAFHNPLAHAVTVALVAGGAELIRRCGRAAGARRLG